MNIKNDPSFESPFAKDPSFESPFTQGTVGAAMGQDWALSMGRMTDKESGFTQAMVGMGMGQDGFGLDGKLFETPADTKLKPESNFTQPIVATGMGQLGFGLDGKMFENGFSASESSFATPATGSQTGWIMPVLLIAATIFVMYLLYKRGATA